MTFASTFQSRFVRRQHRFLIGSGAATIAEKRLRKAMNRFRLNAMSSLKIKPIRSQWRKSYRICGSWKQMLQPVTGGYNTNIPSVG